MTDPVQPWMEKIEVGKIAADLIVSANVPTLVTLTTFVATFEFNWAVPKLIIAGAMDRGDFSVGVAGAFGCDDGILGLTPLHAVRSNDRAKVGKAVRRTR